VDDLDVDVDVEPVVTMTPRDADLLNLLALFLTYVGFALSCLGAPLALAIPVSVTVWYAQKHASREGRTVGLITLVSLFLSMGGGLIVLGVILTVGSLPLAALGALGAAAK
jgi:hypothetical protein